MNYSTPERRTAAVSGFVRACLEQSPHAAERPGTSHDRHSRFLDLDTIVPYCDLVKGTKHRHALHLPDYEPHAAAPVLFEIKLRTRETRRKQRGAVRPGSWS